MSGRSRGPSWYSRIILRKRARRSGPADLRTSYSHPSQSIFRRDAPSGPSSFIRVPSDIVLTLRRLERPKSTIRLTGRVGERVAAFGEPSGTRNSASPSSAASAALTSRILPSSPLILTFSSASAKDSGSGSSATTRSAPLSAKKIAESPFDAPTSTTVPEKEEPYALSTNSSRTCPTSKPLFSLTHSEIPSGRRSLAKSPRTSSSPAPSRSARSES
jgi:hypothetical protein